jgi:hypothetical protein
MNQDLIEIGETPIQSKEYCLRKFKITRPSSQAIDCLLYFLIEITCLTTHNMMA